MSDALNIAASGLYADQSYLDKISHDLANLNTNNYKASKLAFTDMLDLGTTIRSQSLDFSPGPLKPSNQWQDVAINGDGFFQVMDSEGKLLYTRNSTLSIDAEGYLATQDGLRLSDQILIPEQALAISINKTGAVEATLHEGSQPVPLGHIKLAKFVDIQALQPLGDGLYQAKEEAQPLIDTPGTMGLGVILQHQIEASNVDLLSTLTALSLAERSYQLNARALQIADEIEKITNNLGG